MYPLRASTLKPGGNNNDASTQDGVSDQDGSSNQDGAGGDGERASVEVELSPDEAACAGLIDFELDSPIGPDGRPEAPQVSGPRVSTARPAKAASRSGVWRIGPSI